MIVIPAIDLRGGRCVRLFQGDFAKETVYGDDPAAMAARWEGEGAEWLHVVDLDGAVAGRPVQLDTLGAIASRVRMAVEFGGGVRSLDHTRAVFAAGARRAIVGTAALEDPEFLEAACREFPGRVFVALDARDGEVMVRGWTRTSGRDVAEAARDCEARGAGGFLFTDVSRDGTGGGVNVAATAALADAVRVPVIASGGVASLDDVRNVRAVEDRGISALVIGKALYTGAVGLAEAIAAAR
ncbi:MAG: phosphoribosylformimino-5-aminoimidazole carboxamide ribotide isomerase [Candidatus Binatota bacterium]|nr:phosphoribosylformimino-5-aminoimidazole carboxamide ribotide isomerase [Candidatus Binatota bacterium]